MIHAGNGIRLRNMVKAMAGSFVRRGRRPPSPQFPGPRSQKTHGFCLGENPHKASHLLPGAFSISLTLYVKLAASRSARAEWAESYFCGLLGYCSYGVMASQLNAAPAPARAKAESNAQQPRTQRTTEKTSAKTSEKAAHREDQAPGLGKLVDDASSLVESFSKIFK